MDTSKPRYMTSTDRARATTPWRFITLILLVGALMRISNLRELPWGLSQDEVVNADMSLQVLAGPHVPFLRGGFGHEPLFHYIQGIALHLFGDNVIGIRIPAVFLGLVLIACSSRLLHDMLEPFAALVAAGGIAVTWWPTIFSRLGIRAISLPLLLTLAVLFLWRGIKRRRRRMIMASGLVFGLAFYTYTSAFWLPVIGLSWLTYLFIAQRNLIRRHFRGLLGVAIIALWIAAPLFAYLYYNPELQERATQLSGPLQALREGDVQPIIEAIVATLGMFSHRGEARWTYDIPGRPILGPLASVIFYLGLLRCAFTLRRPQSGLLAIWLFTMLTPSMVTPDAPSTIRAIGAIPAAFGVLGYGAAWIKDALRGHRRLGWIFLGSLSLAGLWTAVSTYRDHAMVWASHPEVYWRYKAHFADIATFLDSQTPPLPSVVFETWVDPVDVDGLRRTLKDDDRMPRWTQAGMAFIWPGKAESMMLAVPAFTEIEPVIWSYVAQSPPAVASSSYQFEHNQPSVRFYHVKTQPHLATLLEKAHQPVLNPETGQILALPVNFDQQLTLIGYLILEDEGKPEERLSLITFWSVLRDDVQPITLFLHVLDDAGDLIAQQDRLDVWTEALETGDVFAQLHQLDVSQEVQLSEVHLQLGAYHRYDLTRLPIIEADDQEGADRVWLTAPQ